MTTYNMLMLVLQRGVGGDACLTYQAAEASGVRLKVRDALNTVQDCQTAHVDGLLLCGPCCRHATQHDTKQHANNGLQASEDLSRASLGLYDDDTGPFPISDSQVF